jgi:hypothetical protein
MKSCGPVAGWFETAKRDDCTNLLISLERGQENRHKKLFGSPALLKTIRHLDDILEVLTR